MSKPCCFSVNRCGVFLWSWEIRARGLCVCVCWNGLFCPTILPVRSFLSLLSFSLTGRVGSCQCGRRSGRGLFMMGVFLFCFFLLFLLAPPAIYSGCSEVPRQAGWEVGCTHYLPPPPPVLSVYIVISCPSLAFLPLFLPSCTCCWADASQAARSPLSPSHLPSTVLAPLIYLFISWRGGCSSALGGKTVTSLVIRWEVFGFIRGVRGKKKEKEAGLWGRRSTVYRIVSTNSAFKSYGRKKTVHCLLAVTLN